VNNYYLVNMLVMLKYHFTCLQWTTKYTHETDLIYFVTIIRNREC